MEDQGLSLGKLSKLTGVSRSNLNRMRTDKHCNPTINNLIPIAKFFKISVEQLLGLEEITDTHQYQLNTLLIEKLPILSDYEQIQAYIKTGELPKHVRFTYSENAVSASSFGFVTVDNSMHPLFPKGIVVIFDPQISVQDQSYALAVNPHDQRLLFRKYIDNNQVQLLMPLKNDSKNAQILAIDNNIQILATATECHLEFK